MFLRKPRSKPLERVQESIRTLRNFLREFNENNKENGDDREDLGKIGFVLSGGFFQGAFQIGALDCVIGKFGIVPDYVVGTSVGAINGAAVTAGKVPEATEAWENLKREEVYRFDLGYLMRKGIIGANALLDNTPLLDVFRRNGTGYDLLQSPIHFDVVTTDFQRLESVVFSNREENDPDVMELAILASTALPIVFPPVVIRGNQYVDGGMGESTPIRHAIDAGCETILVFELTNVSARYGGKLAPTKGLVSIGMRIFDVATSRQIKYDIQRVRKVNRDIEVLQQLLSSVEKLEPRIREELIKTFAQFSFAKQRPIHLIVIAPDTPLPYFAPPIRGELNQELLRSMAYYGALVAEKALRQEKIFPCKNNT